MSIQRKLLAIECYSADISYFCLGGMLYPAWTTWRGSLKRSSGTSFFRELKLLDFSSE